MKKLELIHIAPYIPYGLVLLCKNGKKITIQGAGFSEDLGLLEIHRTKKSGYLKQIKSNKPMLKPLNNYSDINGIEMDLLNIDISNQIIIQELASKKIGFWQVPYGVIQIMCEHHIDFQGLIDEGLAVEWKNNDIYPNELNNKLNLGS